MWAAVTTIALSIFRGSFIYSELPLDICFFYPLLLPRGAAGTVGHSVDVSTASSAEMHPQYTQTALGSSPT